MNFWPEFAVFASSALLLPAQETSALEREPRGRVDVTPGSGLSGRTRLATSPRLADPLRPWWAQPGRRRALRMDGVS
jgi:hypothetical protein